MIFNIRGANGSGKSYLVREIFKSSLTEPIIQETPSERKNLFDAPANVKHKVMGYYQPKRNLRIVGSYESACGGCDTIDTQQEVKDYVRLFARDGHVLFEGVLISTIIHPWVEFSKSVGGMVWCFMDTPFELCIQHVKLRNNNQPFKEDLVKVKWDRQFRIVTVVEQLGEKVEWIDHKDSFKSFMKVFKKYAQ
jgi:hypothetical protein